IEVIASVNGTIYDRNVFSHITHCWSLYMTIDVLNTIMVDSELVAHHAAIHRIKHEHAHKKCGLIKVYIGDPCTCEYDG
ncbi:hypothetical protein ACJX0J_014800, partial [Zea mays]